MEAIEARVRESFGQQALMQTFGAEVLSVSDGEVQLKAPILPLALQHTGHGHAGLSFALGDTAAGFAALTKMDAGAQVVTAEIKINLLAPAAGDYLIATGHVIKPGRRLVVVGATVTAYRDGTARDVAVLQGSMMAV